MRWRVFGLVVLLAAPARVDAEEPVELYDCVDDADGPAFCSSDSVAVLVDAGCGTTFNRYHGRIAWPVLRNVGPVTISAKTRVRREEVTQYLPLYVEVVGRVYAGDDYHCRLNLAGIVVLVAQGGPDCGGTWESVGPINLTSFGVPLGALYHVQVSFFESLPPDPVLRSIGLSCIRVTPHPTAVASTTWSNVKVLFR
jgi:hypothetical protein